MAVSQTGGDHYVCLFVIILLFSQFHLALGSTKKCFAGSGDQTYQLPCEPDSQAEGICCDAGDICLSNGLCKYGPNAGRNGSIDVDTYRPGCTDQNWDTENCFSGCNNLKEPLVQSCYDNRYCCYGANGCDCSKTSLFEFNAATFVTTLPLSSATATSRPASNIATTTASSSWSSTLVASASPSPTESPSSPSSHVGVAVGAGVGVGLAVVIIGAVSIFLFLSKKKKQMMYKLPSPSETPYKKGYSMPLHELDGHSAPQEIGHKELPRELDGSKEMKYVHS